MMKFRTFIKLIIFWFLIFVLSCASGPGPRVKEIAELHYGDDESNVVETIGEGSEILFFELNAINYHYRFYTTVLSKHKYALLFADGRLFAVSEERPPFHKCIYLTEWEKCFTDAISAMQVMQLEMTEDEFSGAVTEQEKIERGRTTAVAVGTPVLVVAWPIVLGVGAMCAAQGALEDYYNPIDDMERSRNNSECRKTLDEIEDRIDLLYPNASLNYVINVLNEKSLKGSEDEHIKAVESILDLSGGNHRIYGKSWRCGYGEGLHLDLYFGFDNDHMIWVSKNLYTPIVSIPDKEVTPASEAMLQTYWDDLQHQDAKKWLCLAADTGHPEAQYRLGLLYENGSEGMPIDKTRAYMWYRISASGASYMRAADHAKRVHDGLNPDQAAQADALVREWEPGQCERDLKLDYSDN